MAGYVINCVAKRKLDFSSLGVGLSQEMVLADYVDLIHWQNIVLLLRVHSHSVAVGAGSVTISIRGQSVSRQDPVVYFLDTTTSYPSTSIDSNTTSPAFVGMTIPAVPMMQVFATGTRLSTGSIAAEISIDVSVKLSEIGG